MATTKMVDHTPEFDSDWLARFRAGDMSAFEALFRAFTPGLIAWVRRYVSSRPIAEEIVQELFFAVWQRRGSLEVRQGIRAYLYTAARNRALHHLRHEGVVKRHEASVQDSPDGPPVFGEAELLTILDVTQAIDRLPPKCQVVFRLSRYDGMTNVEIATHLAISIKSVEAHLTRALKLLRPLAGR